MFFAPKIFLGCAPKILDGHYKIGPITDHRAKFQAGRPTHLGDLARKEKIKKNIMRKTEVLPKTISGGLKKKRRRIAIAHSLVSAEKLHSAPIN